MKKSALFLILLTFYSASILAQHESIVPINKAFFHAEKNYKQLLESLNSFNSYPRSLKSDESLRIVNESDWTSGFFPGTLWYIYENTKSEYFKSNARNWTMPIASQRFNTSTHDLGFMFYCSFGNSYRLDKNSSDEMTLLSAANSLLTRYNDNVGCIRSWDFGTWNFPVIIDNMMNLEILFWATHTTGDSTYYRVAVSHALTTLKNHYRNDFSSYHVVDYNSTTGEVISKTTHQGYSDESHWARGQAWGLYGFIMCYRETGDKRFLKQAKNIASFYMNHNNLSEDLIPHWDLLAPNLANEPKDASAGAIIASALIELSSLDDTGTAYFEFAEMMLANLSTAAYLSKIGENGNFILSRSTGNKPGNSEVNTSLNYADYYYLEALIRYQKITNKYIQPYIITADFVTAKTEETVVDSLFIYSINQNEKFGVKLLNNPDFISLESVNDNIFTLHIAPSASDSGIFLMQIQVINQENELTNFEKTIYVDAFSNNNNNNNNNNIVVYSNANKLNHPAKSTLDGNSQSYWQSNTKEDWIMYDLGKDIPLDSVQIAFVDGKEQQYQFLIQISDDGFNWSNLRYGLSNGKTNLPETFKFQSSINARFVKLISYGNNHNPKGRISEIIFPDLNNARLSNNVVSKQDIQIKIMPQELIITGIQGHSTFELFSLRGERILKRYTSSSDEQLIIPISNLKSGIYIIKQSKKSGIFRQKFYH